MLRNLPTRKAAPRDLWSRRDTGALLGVLALQLIIGCVYLTSVPRYYCDESWESSFAFGWIEQGRPASSLIDGFGNMRTAFVQPRITQSMILAAVYRIFGYSVTAGRGASQVMAMLTLLWLYLICRRILQLRPAVCFGAGVLLLSNPYFFIVARRVRPEIYAASFGLLTFYLLLEGVLRRNREERSWPWFVLCGIAGGLSVIAHPTACVVLFASFIAYFVYCWRNVIWSPLLIIGAAAAAVFACYVGYVIYAVQYLDVSLAAQFRHGKGLHALGSAVGFFQREYSRWSHFTEGALLLAPVLSQLLLMLFLFRVSRNAIEKVMALTVVLFLIVLPFASNQPAAVYFSAILPFMSITSVLTLLRWHETFRSKWVVNLCVLLVLVPNVGACLTLTWHHRNYDIVKYVERVQEIVGDQPTLGTIALWQGPDGIQTVDYYWTENDAELWSTRLDSRQKSLEYYRREHPEMKYIVRTSHPFVGSYNLRPIDRPMPTDRLIDAICRMYGEEIAAFDDDGFGKTIIYKVNWDKPADKAD